MKPYMFLVKGTDRMQKFSGQTFALLMFLICFGSAQSATVVFNPGTNQAVGINDFVYDGKTYNVSYSTISRLKPLQAYVQRTRNGVGV